MRWQMRCDELADRLEHQRIVLDDAVTILGEEVTRLRAESGPLVGDDVRRPSLPVASGVT